MSRVDSPAEGNFMWSSPPEPRSQAILFPERLDQAIDPDHSIRQFEALLQQLDWQSWESRYHGRLGQPAYHPRVLAGVLLWGMMNRIRSSRALEEALQVRLDFRWLAEGRQIDHTTLSEFRRRHGEELKKVFVQVCLLARELGHLNLSRLGFDGTRVRANNRRSGTRSVESLRQERDELAKKFGESESKAQEEDRSDEEVFQGRSTHAAGSEASGESAEGRQRLQELTSLLKELEQAEAEGASTPNRLPTTDPDARVMPNKEGGHGVNYTPLTLVDIDSGLIVGEGVLNEINEDGAMLPLLQEVKQRHELGENPALLTDHLNGSASNAAGCEAEGVTLYSPTGVDPTTNPALRTDLQQAVPSEQWDRLPMQKKGRIPLQLAKEAFVYDESQDVYYCPMGKALAYKQTTSEQRGRERRVRRSYQSRVEDCQECALRSKCVTAKSGTRSVSREKHEAARQQLIERMATPEAKAIYELRRHPVERPFAMIKQHFGMRQMLLRGLDRVRVEWRWATLAFNLHRLMGLLRNRAGPPPGEVVVEVVAC
jgi:transposase